MHICKIFNSSAFVTVNRKYKQTRGPAAGNHCLHLVDVRSSTCYPFMIDYIIKLFILSFLIEEWTSIFFIPLYDFNIIILIFFHII